MFMLSDLRYRLRAFFRRDSVEGELDTELQFHLEKHVEKLAASGMPRAEALRQARLALGGLDPVKEQCRDALGTRWLEEFWQDVRYAGRTLRSSPAFAATTVLTLALGIGANTTAFSAANALLFRTLPVNRPAEVVFVSNRTRPLIPNFSVLDYRDIRDRNTVLSALAAYRPLPMGLTYAGRNARLWGYLVSGNYFPMLGVKAALGRTLAPEDDQAPGAHPVAVLSYACWKTRFAGDPSVVGRTVAINGSSYSVVGVAPPEFFGTEFFLSPDVWVPLAMLGQIEPARGWVIGSRADVVLLVIGRLKPGVSSRRAEASLNGLAAQLGRDHPDEDAGMRISLSPPGMFGVAFRGPVFGVLMILLSITGLVLLVACTNLAGLLLARAAGRRREIALRLALGAGRGRLVRQLLAESGLLAAAGGAAGLLLARWLVRSLAAWRPPTDIHLRADFTMDAHVLWFTVAVSVLTSLACGLAPALGAARQDLASAIKGEPPRKRMRRLGGRDLLIVVQIALSLVLLAGAGLMAGGLRRALSANLGLDPSRAVVASFDLELQGYNAERGREFQRRLVEKISAHPGIEAVGVTVRVPLDTKYVVGDVHLESRQSERASEVPKTLFYSVTPGYFRAAGTRLLAGRAFTERDRSGAPWVAVVNQAFADTILRGAPTIGQRFRMSPKAGWIEIVGIVETGKHLALGEAPKPVVYLSMLQNYMGADTVVVRSALPPGQALGVIRDAVAELDPVLPLYNAESLSDHLALPLLPGRTAAAALWGFGGLALLLGATGIYGVVAYSVSRRAREIGIRMAVGAGAPQIVRVVVSRVAVVVAIGASLGSLAAALAGPPMLRILLGEGRADPAGFAIAAAALAAAALIACWSPTRRALRIDPAAALRAE
jgi:predicted permease